MIIQRLILSIDKLIAQEKSPKKLAITFCLGIYIGICPFIGFHTIMTFFLGWFFALNIAGLFTVSFLIHNPWTTLPIYALDHSFGKWFLHCIDIDYTSLDPVWMEWCNNFLMHHTGISGLSLSAFLVGGNLLAVSISVMLYPIAKRILEGYVSKRLLIVQQ